MKAKRLLSAFVAVAMIATMFVAFSTVASAEDVIKPNLTIEFVEMTAGEIEEIAGATEVAQPEGTKAFWLTATLSDYGILDCTNKTSGKGTRKLQSVTMYFELPGAMGEYFDNTEDIAASWYQTDYTDIGTGAIVSVLGSSETEAKILNCNFAGTEAKQCYPTTVTTDEEPIVVAKVPVLLLKDVDFSLSYADVVITEFTANKIAGVSTTYMTTDDTVEATKTFSLKAGEAAPEEPEVKLETIGSESMGEDGVAINGQTDIKYDTAHAVRASLKLNKAATQLGMEFVPKFVNDWSKARGAVCDESVTLGAGEVSFIAAIKNIPRFLENQSFKMLTRAYAVIDGEKVYGEEFESDVLFGDSGEIPKAE